MTRDYCLRLVQDYLNGLIPGRMPNVLLKNASGVGAKNGATVTAAEYGDGAIHKTVLTLAATPISVVGATGIGFGGTKIYDFPAGRIAILGVTASLAFPIVSTEGNLANTADGDWAMGTTSEEDGTMDRATDINLLPKTATSANSLSTAVGAALVATTQIDGTGTAVDVYVNLTIDDAETDETSILGATGTVTISWVNLGDY